MAPIERKAADEQKIGINQYLCRCEVQISIEFSLHNIIWSPKHAVSLEHPASDMGSCSALIVFKIVFVIKMQ